VKQCLLILLVLLFAGCGKPKQQLHVFIWSEYLTPELIADFEQKFDCRVTVDLYETSESMLAKMAAGGASIYDIVVPSSRTLPILVRSGLLLPLRRENIPNLANVAPQFVNPPFDPGNRFGAPFSWDTAGLYLRKSKGKLVEETWGLVFDASKQPGPFLLSDDVRACVGAALRYKGHSLNSTNLEELIEARDLIIGAKKRSLGFEGHTAAKNRVLARGATMAMTYVDIRGVKEDPDTYYFVPCEGNGMSVDVLSIPAQAPHRDLAEKFINYLLDAKVGARLADSLGTATANQAALEFINPDDRNNPAIYPPPEVMQRLEFARDLGDQNKLYDELWTQIKSK